MQIDEAEAPHSCFHQRVSAPASINEGFQARHGSPQVIHIAVRDTGFGISPENQKRIFEKFYRADDQQVRDAPGTGLGLNITKQLVELQGGRIWFESVYREGTTFHLVVPIVEAA